ncbi:amino acid permease C-terminal domain-containing protein [Streptomyces sp. NRRL S-337]|uniref:amino acid permease C-terminal domain-containing protein n=1 Tax=Streptomyces sp. NRRL S-337 TaxID=1463900 RepID=UPI0007C5886E|nr:amino acid permease C-terminal domain-containing protein [Streptomyces sp. NRRL S-337]
MVPLLSIAFCGYLLYGLPAPTYLMFACWLAAALAVYVLYSRHHSRLQGEPLGGEGQPVRAQEKPAVRLGPTGAHS